MSKQWQPDPGQFKTEEQLKEEAKRRREEQARIDKLKPPPPPHKQKADNFWYHYKWHTITAVVLVCAGIFFLRDTVFSTKPDATVIMVTSEPVGTEALTALETALSDMAGDYNGDGKRVMLVNYMYYVPDGAGEADDGAESEEALPQAPAGTDDYATTIKLTTLLAANTDPLYLIDEAIYDYYSHMGTEDGEPQSIFQPLDAIGAAAGDRLPLSGTVIADAPGCEGLDSLTFCIRAPSGDSKKAAEHYEYCLEFLQGIARP